MQNLFRWAHSLCAVAVIAVAIPAWAQSESGSLQVNASPEADVCGQVGVEYTDQAGLTLEEKIRRMDHALARSLNKFDECQEEDIKLPAEQAENEPETQTEQVAAESEDVESESQAEGQESKSKATRESGGTSFSTAGDISGDKAEPAPQQEAKIALPQLPSNITPPPPSTPGGSSFPVLGVQGDGEVERLPAGPSSIASGDLAGDEPEPEPPQQARISGMGVESGEVPDKQGGDIEGGLASRSGGYLNNGKLPEDIPPADNDTILEAQIRKAAINESDSELKKKLWNEYRKYKGLPPVQ